MYHGQQVAGFPPHPHRGFETVTYVRRGFIDHADSLGAQARFGRGDVQWLTAGGGIVHSEMFPLLDRNAPNPVELFQIWLNLPAEDKLADPYFEMLWSRDIPRVTKEADGADAEVTVIAGAFDGHVPPSPPPSSWGSRPDAEVAIWHVRLAPGARVTLPPTSHAETTRVIYVFVGDRLLVAGEEVAGATGARLRTDAPVELAAPRATGAQVEALVLQGRPIGEPVAQYGPFVMNDRVGIEQAFDDYRRTGFGGWPWPTEEPVHGAEPTRFARRPDGTLERAEA